ncbi:hypothetical protein ACWEIJ_36520 [Lentzea sp. NPDC004789]
MMLRRIGRGSWFLVIAFLASMVTVTGAQTAFAATPPQAADSNYWVYIYPNGVEDMGAHCDGSSPGSICTWRPSSSASEGWFYRGCAMSMWHWTNGRNAWFVIGGGHHVYVIYQQDDWSWSPWFDFGGVANSRVWFYQNGVDRPEIAVLGVPVNGVLNDYYRAWNGGSWSNWQVLRPAQFPQNC